MPKLESLLNLFSAQDSGSSSGTELNQTDDPGPAPRYEAPAIFVVGHVRDITLGNSSSGNKDANSQYYW